MQYKLTGPGAFRPRPALLMILVGALLAGGVTLALHDPTLQVRADARPAGATPAARLRERAARLLGSQRHHRSLFAQALVVRHAIRQGRFAAAQKAVERNLQRSRIASWHFVPFARFVPDIPRTNDPGFLHRLDQWVTGRPRAAIPRLIRAQYYSGTGWSIRGNGFISGTPRARLRAFRTDMRRAARDAAHAMGLDGSDPYAAFLLLEIRASAGNTPDLQATFGKAVDRLPHYYPLYRERLKALEPQWGGSVKAMYAFVAAHAGRAAAHSPMKMLYLQLYDDLLETAAAYCDTQADGGPRLTRCIANAMDQLVTPQLEDHVSRTLQMYPHMNKARFTAEVGGLLREMVLTEGAQRYAAAVLQLAAAGTGSDPQLVAKDTGHNNYMIDAMAGPVWYRQGQYRNAEQLFRRAVADLPHMRFPDELARDRALSDLYDDLASVYNHTRQFRKVVVYQEAADVLGGTVRDGNSDLGCYALFELKLYPAAIHACSAQIDDGGDTQAVFWRAKAYAASHRTALALADYRRVARSRSRLRADAAIAISVIYGHNNELRRMLHALDSYPYLFDRSREDDQDLAIAYNNRCYAEMHLGKLRAALKDCTASLRFGSLPDAYAKQQKLIRELKTKGALPAKQPRPAGGGSGTGGGTPI